MKKKYWFPLTLVGAVAVAAFAFTPNTYAGAPVENQPILEASQEFDRDLANNDGFVTPAKKTGTTIILFVPSEEVSSVMTGEVNVESYDYGLPLTFSDHFLRSRAVPLEYEARGYEAIPKIPGAAKFHYAIADPHTFAGRPDQVAVYEITGFEQFVAYIAGSSSDVMSGSPKELTIFTFIEVPEVVGSLSEELGRKQSDDLLGARSIPVKYGTALHAMEFGRGSLVAPVYQDDGLTALSDDPVRHRTRFVGGSGVGNGFE